MSMLTMYDTYEHSDKAPSWITFVQRVKWNYSVENFRTQWFLNLADSEIAIICKTFKDMCAETVANIITNKNLNRLNRNISTINEALKRNRRMFTKNQSRRLYDLINYDFSVALTSTQRYPKSSDISIIVWTEKMIKILVNQQNHFMYNVTERITNLQQAEAKKKEKNTPKNTTFNHLDYLSKGYLPSKTADRINTLIDVLSDKTSWNLDSRTEYEVGKILNEYIPEMVKSYVEVDSMKNAKNTEKVHQSIKDQISILEKYVQNIGDNFVSEKMYTMNLQHQLITDKYGKNSLTS